MSDMHFREPNQVKWQGSRPGHNGTQINVGLNINAIGATDVYEVPAGETAFITLLSLSHADNVNCSFWIRIYDAVPALYRNLWCGYHFLNFPTVTGQLKYWPPLEIPAGYFITFRQSVNADMFAHVHGWSE